MAKEKEAPYEGWKEFPKWVGSGAARQLVYSAEEEAEVVSAEKAAEKPVPLPTKK